MVMLRVEIQYVVVQTGFRFFIWRVRYCEVVDCLHTLTHIFRKSDSISAEVVQLVYARSPDILKFNLSDFLSGFISALQLTVVQLVLGLPSP